MTDTITAIARASSLASRATARLIKDRGGQDIARAGKFGTRWQDGLTVRTDPASGFQIRNEIVIAHTEPGARNFEFGGTVQGKPLLWIPLSFSDAKGKRAADYPGGLFRVDRKSGPPLLLAIRDRQPKYVGKASVRIPQKFHLRDVAAGAMRVDFPKLYQANLKV